MNHSSMASLMVGCGLISLGLFAIWHIKPGRRKCGKMKTPLSGVFSCQKAPRDFPKRLLLYDAVRILLFAIRSFICERFFIFDHQIKQDRESASTLWLITRRQLRGSEVISVLSAITQETINQLLL
jgi:hypothetical protein